jgi:hypothetical protein
MCPSGPLGYASIIRTAAGQRPLNTALGSTVSAPRGSEHVLPALERLREYMYRLYPEHRRSSTFPLEFWKIEDDALFMEALGYLPLHMGVTDEGIVPGLEQMPEGFQLAFPIFWIEDDYHVNGWTALTNAGEWLLPRAISAYQRIGMTSEARALAAALESCKRAPCDDDAAEAAYISVDNEFSDDTCKHHALLAFFRAHSQLFEQ